MNRVVVTGIGLFTPLAKGVEGTWNGLVEGRSAIGPIKGFDTSSLRSRLGGELPDFQPQEFATRRLLRMMTRNDQLALAGATLAFQDSGLEVAEDQRHRVGVYVGTNKNDGDPSTITTVPLESGEDGRADTRKVGEDTSIFNPLFYVEGLPAGSLFYISLVFGLMGANAHFAGGAEAGLTAVGRAYRSVRRGEADVALAGGFDNPVFWWGAMPHFDTLGVLSDRNELGAAACRPYDRDRSGIVLGEATAFLLLEERTRAEKRGARMYAEITGYAGNYDAYKFLVPSPTGEGVARVLTSALGDAGSTPDEIDYICAGGNGSPLGDAAEVRGIGQVFGDQGRHPAVSSVKAATGECMAGSGALNAAVAALAIHHGIAPPTLNLNNPDPDCGLDWICGTSRVGKIRQAAALAEGLEGSNVAMIMQAVE